MEIIYVQALAIIGALTVCRWFIHLLYLADRNARR